MLGRLRTALKFMTYGVLIGIFFAPAKGDETRRRVMDWVKSSFRDLFSGMTGGQSNP